MKKFLTSLLIASAISGTLVTVFAEDITVKLNGNDIVFDDAKPFIDDAGRTQVPVRKIAETAGLNVSWDNETQTVSLSSDSMECSFEIGKTAAMVKRFKNDGSGDYEFTVMDIDTEALIVGDRTYIPVAYLAEAMSMAADWDENTSTVSLRPQNDSDVPKHFPGDSGLPSHIFANGYKDGEVPQKLSDALSRSEVIYGEGRSVESAENYSDCVNISDKVYKQKFNLHVPDDSAEWKADDTMFETQIFDNCDNLAVNISVDGDPVWISVSVTKVYENNEEMQFRRKWHADAIDKSITIDFDNLDSSCRYYVIASYYSDYSGGIKDVSGVISVAAY